MMKALALLLGLFAASPHAAAAEAPAAYDFESGLDGFTGDQKGGALHWEKQAPLQGSGSLGLSLAEGRNEWQVLSPEFPVRPWTIYRATLLRRIDRGAELVVAVRLKAGETWRRIRTVESSGGYLFGTLPDSTRARVELILRVPGKALGRSATVDDLAVREHAPMVRKESGNRYWDGSFETDLSLPPDGWTFWVNPPKKVEFVPGSPRGGKKSLRIHGDQTYPVFPVVPVQPRRLYCMRYWVRGEGAIYPGLHKLGARTLEDVRLDTAVRIGWSEGVPSEVRLKPDAWQQVEFLTPCEDKRVIWFQPYFVLRGGFVDVAEVEMRSVSFSSCAAVGPSSPARACAPTGMKGLLLWSLGTCR